MHAEALLGLWLVGWLGGPLPAPAEPLPTMTAYVTRADGAASAELPGGRLLELRPGRVLPGGSTISVPAGGSVALVCSDERRVVLGESGERRSAEHSLEIAAETACTGGEPLLPGTYRALARGDRDLALERSGEVRHRILQVTTRGSEEDDPRVPTLLAPRETAVRDPRPEIRWTRVAGAQEYVLELLGPADWTVRLSAEEVPCGLEAHPPGGLEVCAVPWPPEAPDLGPGAPSFLTVGARVGIAGEKRSGEPRLVRLLPAEATGLDESLDALDEMDLATAEAAIRRALLLHGASLRNDAADALRQSLLDTPSAHGYLLQAGLELEALLPLAALRSLREAARLTDDPLLAAEVADASAAARSLLARNP